MKIQVGDLVQWARTNSPPSRRDAPYLVVEVDERVGRVMVLSGDGKRTPEFIRSLRVVSHAS